MDYPLEPLYPGSGRNSADAWLINPCVDHTNIYLTLAEFGPSVDRQELYKIAIWNSKSEYFNRQ